MMASRMLMILAVLLIVSVPAMAQGGYDRNSPEFRESTSQFMCLCGCGQDHFECNMDGCGLNEQFKTEILEMLNEGYEKGEIKDHYVTMYGEVILTAPEKSGFSLTAWVTPFILLAGAGGGVTFLIRKWVRKSKGVNHVTPKDDGDGDEAEKDILNSLIEEERKKHF
ncbi:cytochrome c-type biogenesis protein CcmH [Salipaludibacillus aurantiacus]|uniref:Cytochrome c-type biogenesis protein n=2 Tax=Salipaludibacillus aurantiacus TaxID=1601833 RepID=A0A1H9X7V4_9BACI|nr:cytochrome c-type biogenesis protein CcmH [Salipaludibacillus aurantiacus]